jgi:3-hydroxyacyl-CoA dehydrogenase
MDYKDRLQNVSVLGAAGKMGSGILLLTAVEMADIALLPENHDKSFVLNAIDTNPVALKGLMKYLRAQVLKMAEKKIIWLRQIYSQRADLIENGEIIDEYVTNVLNIVQTGTRIESAFDSFLVFEAIKEDPALKVSIFSKIDKNNPNKPWFFTNTSSIPISKLNLEAKLENRIIGFHFYNPPAVQKLVELIKTAQPIKELEDFAVEFAKRLKKVLVHSNDFAGFIGNGHFMRDALYGISEAEKLKSNMPLVEAIYSINKISQDYLIRPMGIFQLIDYVGVDVCHFIMGVMAPYFPDEILYSQFLDDLLKSGIQGGQNHEGSQKDGILKYEKGSPVAVFNLSNKTYQPIQNFKDKCDNILGKMPSKWLLWKNLIKETNKNSLLEQYFNELKGMNSLGASLAKSYHLRSRQIGIKLVKEGIALSNEDVNTVMLTGFFHAYGPISDFLKD